MLVKCGSCGAESAAAGRFCASCGAPFNSDLTAATTGAATTGAADDRPEPRPSAQRALRPASKPKSSSPSSSRSPRSSGLATEASFLPGALLVDRYRIVALLGRGGMGEVYRADDLILSQPVALKFLPESITGNDEAAERFRNEVRTARRVSHPNVCRVYDVGEVEGRLFLSMEYVDGEDLASLLRRIGRLPGDKALEIARQLCAGLAAAHREGVLHRDLKPANVMLDGRGRAVIADFGLAGLAEQIEGYDVRSGTPAYMSPEQLAGREVTVRSDIYSLGLVLYEIFTGKRAFDAATVAEIVKQRREPLSTPSTWVKDLDPAVERVILRCLESDASRRPSTAIAVAAALPGGDPLAAALEAGETPSPEMVAASGETEGIAPRWAVASLAAVVLGIAAVVVIGLQVSGLKLINPTLPPEVLGQKARETIQTLGYSPQAVDHAALFYYNTDFTDYVHNHSKPRPDWPAVLSQRPQVLVYSYRQSPVYLDPDGFHMFLTPGVVAFDDPPITQSGMINITLDAEGRLIYFQAIPKEIDPNPPPARAVDWNPLFAAAGLDPAEFHSAEPTWLSLAAFDERAAWTGSWPGSKLPLRVEAAAWRGKPVFFDLIGVWTTPDRTAYESLTSGQHASQIIEVILGILLFGAGALVARRSYARGKSDIRGAFRLASAVFVIEMVLWVCVDHFIPMLATFGRFIVATSTALFLSAAIWVLYIALEPYVRRHWPHAIVSWSRLLTGRWRDPLVGRDLLWGVLLGVLWSLIISVGFLLVKREGATPQLADTSLLLGTRHALGWWLLNIIFSITGTLQFFFLLFLLRVVLRNRWLALICFVGIFTVLNTLRTDLGLITFPFWIVVYALAAAAVSRFGLIVLATGVFTSNVLLNIPYTLDFYRWYTTNSALIVASFLAIAAWGFYTSLGGQRILKSELFE